MWLSLSSSFFSSLSLFLRLLLLLFLCLFYSLIRTLYTIILEWSFQFSRLFFSFACVCVFLVQCACSKSNSSCFLQYNSLVFSFLCLSEHASTEKTLIKQTVTLNLSFSHTHTRTQCFFSIFLLFVIYTYLVSVLYLRTARITTAAALQSVSLRNFYVVIVVDYCVFSLRIVQFLE